MSYADRQATRSKPKPATDRMWNESAERALLGSLLMDCTDLAECAAALGTAEAFYQPDHRIVWSAISQMAASGKPIDIVTIRQEMSASGDFERVGGDSFFIELVESVPTAVHAAYYARIVGREYSRRRAYQAFQSAASDLLAARDDDIAVVLAKASSVLSELTAEHVSGSADACDIGKLMIDEIAAGGSGKRPTGYETLDQAWAGGLGAGEVVVIAGRPGHGKSTMATQVALRTAMDTSRGCPVVIYSHEVAARAVVRNIVSSMQGVSARLMENADLSPEEMAIHFHTALSRLPAGRLWVVDNIADEEPLLADAAARVKRDGVGLVVVDYLQLVRPALNSKTATRQDQVSHVSRSLKLFALQNQVTVIAVAQCNRGPESRPSHVPTLADLRESGAIENDADVVCLLVRPELYWPDKEPGTVFVCCAKVRNGPTGTYRMSFSGGNHKIEDFADPARRRVSADPETTANDAQPPPPEQDEVIF